MCPKYVTKKLLTSMGFDWPYSLDELHDLRTESDLQSIPLYRLASELGRIRPEFIIPVEPTPNIIHHIVTGEAGVGKSSSILRKFPGYVYLAPTDSAAHNIRGHTIKSHIKPNTKAITSTINTPGIVIDDCYSATLHDMERLNEMLQIVMRDTRPFGNKRMVFIGDHAQRTGDFMESELFMSLETTQEEIPYHDFRVSPEYRELIEPLRTPMTDDDLQAFIDRVRGRYFCSNEYALTVCLSEEATVVHNERMLDIFPGDFTTIRRVRTKLGSSIMFRKDYGNILAGVFYTLKEIDEEAKTYTVYRKYMDEKVISMSAPFVNAWAVTVEDIRHIHMMENFNLDIRGDVPNKQQLIYIALSRVKDNGCIHLITE